MPTAPDEREVVSELPEVRRHDQEYELNIEIARRKLLAMTAEDFEHLVSLTITRSGFERVSVTRFTKMAEST